MRIRLLYFGILRDITGTHDTELTVSDGTKAVEVWGLLRGTHRELATYDRPPLTAINDAYSPPDSILCDGDVLAFIPPVAGG